MVVNNLYSWMKKNNLDLMILSLGIATSAWYFLRDIPEEKIEIFPPSLRHVSHEFQTGRYIDFIDLEGSTLRDSTFNRDGSITYSGDIGYCARKRIFRPQENVDSLCSVVEGSVTVRPSRLTD